MGMNENTTLFILEILLILVFIIHLVLEITNNKGNNNDVIICDSRMILYWGNGDDNDISFSFSSYI